MNYSTALIAGIDIPLTEFQTTIHQPTIKEIALIGEEDYFLGVQLFCFNKEILLAKEQEESVAAQLSNLNDFQIFMELVNEKGGFDKKNTVLSILALFFPDYNPQFSPLGNGIFLNNPKTQHNFTINDTNFGSLKKIIQEISGLNLSANGQNSGFNPKGKKAAKIAAKLMSGRAKAAGSKGEKGGGLLARYVSILTIGLGSMSIQDCLNMTVYQLYDLVERYSLYIEWDLDIRSRLAGGTPDSKPDDWMKNIH